MDVESRLRELGIAGRIKHRVIGDNRAFIVMPHELIYLTTDQVERVLLHDISKIASDKTGTLNIFSSAYMAISVNIRGFDPVALKTFFIEVKNAVAHAKAEESGVELPPVSGLQASRPVPTVTPSVTASGIHPAPAPITSPATPAVTANTLPPQPPVQHTPDVMLGRPTITPAATPKATRNNWGSESLDEPLDAIDDALEPADSGIHSHLPEPFAPPLRNVVSKAQTEDAIALDSGIYPSRSVPPVSFGQPSPIPAINDNDSDNDPFDHLPRTWSNMQPVSAGNPTESQMVTPISNTAIPAFSDMGAGATMSPTIMMPQHIQETSPISPQFLRLLTTVASRAGVLRSLGVVFAMAGIGLGMGAVIINHNLMVGIWMIVAGAVGGALFYFLAELFSLLALLAGEIAQLRSPR